MILPLELWTFILSYLPSNELTVASAVCKCFYHLLRKKYGFLKKVTDSTDFFRYFKLVRNFGNYHFHVLVITKEYALSTLNTLLTLEQGKLLLLFLPSL